MNFVDLRMKFPGVRAQHGLHSCTAFALCDAVWWELRGENELQGNGWPPTLSPLFLYYNARKRNRQENLNIPVCISDALKALSEYGVCSEEEWPYDLGRFCDCPTSQAYAAAQPNVGIRFEKVPQHLKYLKNCLEEGSPFFFCLRLFESNCWDFDYGEIAETGFIKIPDQEEGPVRNHALLAVGYDDSSSSILARNSLGDKWGDNGYVSIPYDYVINPKMAYAFWQFAQYGRGSI